MQRSAKAGKYCYTIVVEIYIIISNDLWVIKCFSRYIILAKFTLYANNTRQYPAQYAQKWGQRFFWGIVSILFSVIAKYIVITMGKIKMGKMFSGGQWGYCFKKSKEEKVQSWMARITGHCRQILKAIFFYREAMEILTKKIGQKNTYTAWNK